MGTLLEVKNLQTQFVTRSGVVRAVDDVSWDVAEGETVALVGESGCGKSVSALSIMRLVAGPAGRIAGGQVLFKGRDLLRLSEEEMRRVRGREIAMVFQEPMTSLNPVLTIARQLTEGLEIHLKMSPADARRRAIELLGMVGIPDPERRLGQYPHQFSGGMRQRMMIAMALACNPSLILADEPTTALDVTIQAQILDLIRSLSAEFGTAVILITHDLGIAAGMCDRVNVMYAGRIVETGSVDVIFERPRMPYAWGLLDSLPRLDDVRSDRLRTIEGLPPLLINVPDACRFNPRCAYARDACRDHEPGLTPREEPGHYARCWATDKGGWIP